MGGNLISLNKSENSFIFGDGPSTPSLGRAKVNILGHVFSIDIVSHDIPGLIGMDILTSKYNNKSIFRLNLGDRQLIIDNEDIDLLGDKQSHLHLPDNLVKISSSFTQGKSSSNFDSKTNIAYFQDEDVPHDGSRGRQVPGVGQEGQLEDPPQPPRCKTPDKGKLKATLQDIKLPEDSNKRLNKKDYDRPGVIAAKNEELEKFFKFNFIKSVPRAPRGAEVMRTTWVITEKSDNMSKLEVRLRLGYAMHNGQLRQGVLQGFC